MPYCTINAVVEIHEDRRLIVQLPADVPAGKHRVVAVIDTENIDSTNNSAVTDSRKFPVIEMAQWPADMPLTREELYDDVTVHGSDNICEKKPIS